MAKTEFSDFDIVIVGSGPAGSATALYLSKYAPELLPRTVILEQAVHPRHKLCGGGVVVDAEVCLAELGLSINEVPYVDVEWANLIFHGRGPKIQITDDLAFRVVRRDEFDMWLAHSARRRGATLHEGVTVREVRIQDSYVEVVTDRGTYRAQAVVGADGAKSVVRRAVIPPQSPGGATGVQIARLIEVLTPQVPSQPAPEHPRREAIFEFACVPGGIQGYFWSFPTQVAAKPMRNWGVYDSRVRPQESGGSLKPVLTESMQDAGFPPGSYELAGCPLRWYDPAAPVAGPRVLLAGDAAGADALFGEGISLAIGYGELAALALRDAFRRKDFSFADYHRQVKTSAMGEALKLRLHTAKLLFGIKSPSIHRVFWWRLGPLISWYVRRFVFFWSTRRSPKIHEPLPEPAPRAPQAGPGSGSGGRSGSRPGPN